jgi:hypothetical protein
MKGIPRWPTLALAAIVLLNGCSRREEAGGSANQRGDGTHIQPAAIAEESDPWGSTRVSVPTGFQNQGFRLGAILRLIIFIDRAGRRLDTQGIFCAERVFELKRRCV